MPQSRHQKCFIAVVLIMITMFLCNFKSVEEPSVVPVAVESERETSKTLPKRNGTDASELYVYHKSPLSFLHRSKKSRDWFEAVSADEDKQLHLKPGTCRVAEWNKVHTDRIPNQEKHDMWLANSINNRSYLYHLTLSPLAAFVYEEHITVTLTSENKYARTAYCRYYDCNRNELSNPYKSRVFPESTVYCGRRIGAEYISVTEKLEEVPETPVPIQRRDGKVSRHYFTVCMATLYGDEPKFLQIVDFIEYHKLQGATFFHIYLRNASAYDRILLDDYVRTGEIELIVLNDHYWRADFMWHMMQINDCHMRSQNLAKWTAFIDIDERIEVKGEKTRVVDYLETVKDPNVNSLQFSVQWVLKEEDTPARYINDKHLIENMIFRKYHNTSQIGNANTQPKCIIRPERIGAMTIHGPMAVYKGYIQTLVNTTAGVIRHYRNVRGGALYKNNERAFTMGPFYMTSIESKLEKTLTEKILARVKNVYDTVLVSCEEMNKTYGRHGGLRTDC